jgi:hypothetical protein
MKKSAGTPASIVRASRLYLLWIATILLLPGVSNAEEERLDSPDSAKLFEAGDTMSVTIKAPWKTILKETENRDPWPGVLEYTDQRGNRVELPLTVARRGAKREEYCRFPPIKLRFRKEDVKGTTFRGQKSLKLVTHCENRNAYEQYYVVEMLIYRMYQELTDYSFRVRPLEVVYYDSERAKADKPRFAFLIEDDSDLAKRYDLKTLDIPSIHYKRMEPHLTSVFSLFQYMIGNVDWAALKGPDPDHCCHNVKLIAPDPLAADDWIYLIPYDFDSSGLVDAEYALPPRGLPINDVTKRLYRGFCWHDETLDEARALFIDKESAIMAVIDNEERLNVKTRRQVEQYIEEFYEIIRSPKQFESAIRSKCRGKSKSP